MARLEKCPTCDNATSENATVCPVCGEPFEYGWADFVREERRRAEEEEIRQQDARIAKIKSYEFKVALDEKRSLRRKIKFWSFVIIGLPLIFFSPAIYDFLKLQTIKAFNPGEYQKVFNDKEEQRLAELSIRIEVLEAEVAKVPVADYEENLRIYNQLKQLDPADEIYQSKIKFYENKKKEQQVVDSATALEARMLFDVDMLTDISLEQRQIIKQGALKVLRDDQNCEKVTWGFMSETGEDRYFVTCEAVRDGLPYNVWFYASDLDRRDVNFKTPEPYPSVASRIGCIDAIKARLNHPSTLDLDIFTGYSDVVANNGNRVIQQTFAAKNSFGLEINYNARCLITPDGQLEIDLTEQQ